MRSITMARFEEAVVEDEKAIGTCESCGEEIVASEERFNYCGDLVHNDTDCIKEHFTKIAELVDWIQ